MDLNEDMIMMTKCVPPPKENTSQEPFFRYLAVLEPIGTMPPSRSVITQRTLERVHADIANGELMETIRMMLTLAGADRFLPPQYAKFQTVVLEGAIFVLTHLPKERIVEKLVDQLILPMDASPGERICKLVQDMPTLHKLSQIIGRSPGIDETLKRSLVDLEDNISTVTYDTIKRALMEGLKAKHPSDAAVQTTRNQEQKIENIPAEISIAAHILAEASVCAVIPGSVGDQSVVFKMVKPLIKKRMASELALWARLGDYLDENKEKWGLGDFQFKGTIEQVSWLLQNEVDLTMEQHNLEAVQDYYDKIPSVLTPGKMTQSTPDVTVMQRLDGNKITDVDGLTLKQKRNLAKKVTRLCILQPIVELDRESVFHGDPHAGNIAYRFDDDTFFKGAKPNIIFYDWAMVGRLKRLERLAVVLMISGLILENTTVIYYAADIMSGGKITADRALGLRVQDLISDIVDSRETRIKGVLGSVENLIERIMYLGVVFSPDLLVFEKGLVTLKGVLADIDPTFDRDEYVVMAAVGQFVSDIMHFKLQSVIFKEVWALYKYSFSLFLNIQKTLIRFGWELVKFYGLRIPAL